jgi:hypothetical protein
MANALTAHQARVELLLAARRLGVGYEWSDATSDTTERRFNCAGSLCHRAGKLVLRPRRNGGCEVANLRHELAHAATDGADGTAEGTNPEFYRLETRLALRVGGLAGALEVVENHRADAMETYDPHSDRSYDRARRFDARHRRRAERVRAAMTTTP